jgi:hypothetical protein
VVELGVEPCEDQVAELGALGIGEGLFGVAIVVLVGAISYEPKLVP